MISQDIIAILDSKDKLMEKGFAEGNAELITNEYYTKDAWVVGPDDATWKGRDHILELYKSVVGTYTWESKRTHLMQTSEDSITEFMIGTIYPTGEGETLVYKLQFVWTKSEGEWKCASQFFAYGKDFENAA
ncbi:nuclear transport factor 2 family protein [Acinetobacter tandoii]|nr:nuclear transport factor 2 family protein [Acinetobacter tandoii]